MNKEFPPEELSSLYRLAESLKADLVSVDTKAADEAVAQVMVLSCRNWMTHIENGIAAQEGSLAAYEAIVAAIRKAKPDEVKRGVDAVYRWMRKARRPSGKLGRPPNP